MRLVFVLSLLPAPLAAQTTWIVNAGGGPGVNFLDLPAAVAAAASGDTIVVQTGPFGEGATPFSTDKGLTIVGDGGEVPLTASETDPIAIVGLPATEAFRMVGFRRTQPGAFGVHVVGCAGQVHLEELRCYEPAAFWSYAPSVVVFDSDSVTLRGVETFGTPAVAVDSSRVALADCTLGRTSLGLGGGPCLHANYSTVDVVEPSFDTLLPVPAAVELLQCDTRIAGSASSGIVNQGVAIWAFGGSLRIDPRVSLSVGGPFGAPVVGAASWQLAPVPGTFSGSAAPGSTLEITTATQPGALVATAIGRPGALTATPLGPLGIDLTAPYGLLPVLVAGPGGLATASLPVPVALPLGEAFAVQAAVLLPGALELSLPCTFVVH